MRELQVRIEDTHIDILLQLKVGFVNSYLAVEQQGPGHLVDEEDVRVDVGFHCLQCRAENLHLEFGFVDLSFQFPDHEHELVAALDVQRDLFEAGGDAL